MTNKPIASTEQSEPVRKNFPHLKDDKSAAQRFADKYKKKKGRTK